MTPRAQDQRRAAEPVADRAGAIAARFDGDAALYDAFAAACRLQFVADAAAGRAACAAGDLPALTRLAHNLASALTMLGHDDISRLAGRVEAQAGAGDAAAFESWEALCALLQRLAPGIVTE
ncbi:MAG TPA: Hpt domain-containing protein [Burkholderiaceae bacterium]